MNNSKIKTTKHTVLFILSIITFIVFLFFLLWVPFIKTTGVIVNEHSSMGSIVIDVVDSDGSHIYGENNPYYGKMEINRVCTVRFYAWGIEHEAIYTQKYAEDFPYDLYEGTVVELLYNPFISNRIKIIAVVE